ncbi:MAG: hypothetical protein IPO60_02900 [Flavobacteriales bacterium]|mgnify:FL=1|nr:hypothetical protein [Flavobacteriales bacterium]MBK6892120.1 hypothetical protein [Flavobacteriales bacterium]MBK7246255.1 hypothetical protein [Flavobacteriales bacterium]MBK7286168.1 hypothetical protein [Flavobacteriales bacterium]MBK9059978.1 hypothetical protein [Flavobacteriales bacterium]
MASRYSRRWSAAVLRMALLVVCVITFSPASHCQVDQIQAVITGIVSPQHAAEINAVLAAQPNVVMSRTDMYTKNLLIHALPECTLDLGAINTLIQPFGVSAHCFKRGPLAPSGQFKHLDPQACNCGPALNR